MATSKEKEAFRNIYEHYGKDKVLDSDVLLYNAIGDILGADGKKLRNQLKMALDAGINKVYLQQLNAPSAGFDQRVIALLEDAGLSSSSAASIKELYDYMVGFTVVPQPIPQPTPEPQPVEEIRRTPAPQPAPQPSPQPSPAEETVSDIRWTKAVPTPMTTREWGIAFGWSMLVVVINAVSIQVSNVYWPLVFYPALLIAAVTPFGILYSMFKKPKQLAISRTNDGRLVCFPDAPAKATSLGIAVDGKWVMMDVSRDHVELDLAPGTHKITLASFSNGAPSFVSCTTIMI